MESVKLRAKISTKKKAGTEESKTEFNWMKQEPKTNKRQARTTAILQAVKNKKAHSKDAMVCTSTTKGFLYNQSKIR